MTDELTFEEIPTDDNDPATKGFVREEIEKLAQATQKGFNEIRAEMATKDDLKTFKDEIIQEFKVVAENIHQDVAGANKDEIMLIKDQQLPDHEERLQILENKTGVSIGPRF